MHFLRRVIFALTLESADENDDFRRRFQERGILKILIYKASNFVPTARIQKCSRRDGRKEIHQKVRAFERKIREKVQIIKRMKIL